MKVTFSGNCKSASSNPKNKIVEKYFDEGRLLFASELHRNKREFKNTSNTELQIHRKQESSSSSSEKSVKELPQWLIEATNITPANKSETPQKKSPNVAKTQSVLQKIAKEAEKSRYSFNIHKNFRGHKKASSGVLSISSTPGNFPASSKVIKVPEEYGGHREVGSFQYHRQESGSIKSRGESPMSKTTKAGFALKSQSGLRKQWSMQESSTEAKPKPFSEDKFTYKSFAKKTSDNFHVTKRLLVDLEDTLTKPNKESLFTPKESSRLLTKLKASASAGCMTWITTKKTQSPSLLENPEFRMSFKGSSNLRLKIPLHDGFKLLDMKPQRHLETAGFKQKALSPFLK